MRQTMRRVSVPSCLTLLLFTYLMGCRVPIDPADPGDAGDLRASDLGADGPGRRDLGGWTWDLSGDGGGDAVRVGGVGELSPATPWLQVTLADVGQGDGSVVRLPGGQVLVVDGGPYADRFENILTALGITRVDYIVLSHAHIDHYGGLSAAIARLPMDCAPRFFDPGFDRQDAVTYVRTKAAAGCRYQAVRAGQTLNLDPAVETMVLAAHEQRFGSQDDSHGINNTSVVLRLRHGRFSVLFEGDAESEAERDTLQTMGANAHSTVLKLGHHGSCTSTAQTYLGAVAPQFAMMSLSATNTFGHPHCQTMAKLRAQAGLRWGRTDVNGPVTLTSDGVAYAVSLARGAESVDTCPRSCASPQDF